MHFLSPIASCSKVSALELISMKKPHFPSYRPMHKDGCSTYLWIKQFALLGKMQKKKFYDYSQNDNSYPADFNPGHRTSYMRA